MRRRMTPSRRAQGQISSSGTPNRSIAASATMTPADSCGARPSETPGSLTRSARLIVASRDAQVAASVSLRTRRTYGPSLDGAAPAILASCRNVFDVATARSGRP